VVTGKSCEDCPVWPATIYDEGRPNLIQRRPFLFSKCPIAVTLKPPVKTPFGDLSRSGYPWLDCESDSTYRLTSESTVSIFVNMSATNIKEEAKRLLEKLPDNLTWDDLMHEIYVRQSIEAGLADSETGKVVEVSDVRRQFGLPS